MDEYKYYSRYDEKILVVAALLLATLILFVLTFFLGYAIDGTHTGTLGTITYPISAGPLPENIKKYTKVFKDNTTGTTIEIGWKARCDSNGCMNVSGDIVLMNNSKNCIVHAFMPKDALNSTFENSHIGVTDIILTFEMTSMLDGDLHVYHYQLFADGGTELCNVEK
jgi:hypothetical protein